MSFVACGHPLRGPWHDAGVPPTDDHRAAEPNTLPPGATEPGSVPWSPPARWRAFERTAVIGRGDEVWSESSRAVLEWGVKTRSGFRVEPGGRVRVGDRHQLRAVVGPFSVLEPVEVVAVVETDDRCGFAYGTLPGHPVRGEEAFVVHRDGAGTVYLTLRSLTRAGSGRWRAAFPAILVAQRRYRRRYLRALGRG